MERDRVTVQEASRRLGISESGVRKRVKRRQLDSTNEGGRVFVYLDSVGTEAVPDSVPDKYTARLEDEVAYLREMLRREQEINAMHASNMRALSAPESSPEPRESPTPSPQASEGTRPSPEREEAETGTQRRPWWRGWFGG
jgi:DNA-binding Lrp family transcriptional regulator